MNMTACLSDVTAWTLLLLCCESIRPVKWCSAVSACFHGDHRSSTSSSRVIWRNQLLLQWTARNVRAHQKLSSDAYFYHATAYIMQSVCDFEVLCLNW